MHLPWPGVAGSTGWDKAQAWHTGAEQQQQQSKGEGGELGMLKRKTETLPVQSCRLLSTPGSSRPSQTGYSLSSVRSTAEFKINRNDTITVSKDYNSSIHIENNPSKL